MNLLIPSPRHSSRHRPRVLTAGGLARSGKGTSMEHLKLDLERDGQSVELIDQGLKYRALGRLARKNGKVLDSPTLLADFVSSDRTQRAAQTILDKASVMDSEAKNAYLYTSEISDASGKVGKLKVAHQIASGMLRKEMERAVDRERKVVLIDGRAMEIHARQFDKERLADFVAGWYFKCDSGVAALRSLGWTDREHEELTDAENIVLATETTRIRTRNHSDVTRTHEPSREPADAHRLDLLTYYEPDIEVPFGRGHVVRPMGMVVVETSFTTAIEQMTDPVTEVSRLALDSYGTHLLGEPASMRVA